MVMAAKRFRGARMQIVALAAVANQGAQDHSVFFLLWAAIDCPHILQFHIMNHRAYFSHSCSRVVDAQVFLIESPQCRANAIVHCM
eukprot:m.367564 g.367564  ORF g.367564 m.367564 type:complete len:86 (-) comp28102_c0_seq2:120-377(-)